MIMLYGILVIEQSNVVVTYNQIQTNVKKFSLSNQCSRMIYLSLIVMLIKWQGKKQNKIHFKFSL